MMTLYERRQTILRLLHERTSVHVTELSRLLDVSEGTIRNDLTAMEEEGLIVRVRGGAAMRNTTPPATTFTSRAQVNFDAKRRIAQWAADMIEDGDTIALDASTTVLNIASFLHDRRGLSIITNGIEVARTLAQNHTHTVILLGGVLRADGNAINGTLGQAMLKDLHVKTAFVSCVGLTLENGLTEADMQQAQIKELLIDVAGQVVLLVDSSKIGQVGLVPFAALPQVAHIVTDDEIAPSMIDELRRYHVKLTVCGEDTVDTFAPLDVESQPSRIGFANLSEDLLFAVDVRRGLERAVQSAGQINLVLADNQMNSDVALSVADHLIARGLDLMIEYQLDESMGSVIMDKFKRANIPVIAVDIPMVGATYFGVDNFRAGHLAGIALGEWIAVHWSGDAQAVIVLEEPRSGALTAARIQGQLYGLREVIGDSALANTIYLDSGNTREVSEAQVFDVLRQLDGLQRIAIVCFNDDAAIGALNAARRANRQEHVVIVGQGADRRLREEIRKSGSRIIGSTAFLPEQYGGRLLDLAQKILRGEPVPPAVYTDHIFINAENVALYYPD
jgi:ribose transport system substrate-binding protein